MKSQKELITKALQTNKIIYNWDSLPFETCDKLMDINDTEILPQEVDRFIHDYRIKHI